MRRALIAALLAVASLGAAGDAAKAIVPIKVDDPEVLIVVFDYDGLAPMVMQISFILYTDGTFALLRHGASGDDADTYAQGKLDAADALDLTTRSHADLATVASNVYDLKDVARGGWFEVWHWNPADHLYSSTTVLGHPCDASGSTPIADGLTAFCHQVAALRDRDPLEQHPVHTSFMFTKAEDDSTAEVRPIPAELGAKEIDADIPIVGICADGKFANDKAAELIAPNASGAVAYRFDDLPPLELTQIIRATYLPKAYTIPLGDEMTSVGDPCNQIRSGAD